MLDALLAEKSVVFLISSWAAYLSLASRVALRFIAVLEKFGAVGVMISSRAPTLTEVRLFRIVTGAIWLLLFESALINLF